jgi:hypothetical protein
LLAERAKRVEQRVTEPETVQGLLSGTVTPAKAMQRRQEQGNEQDKQDDSEPEPPAQGRQIYVPLQLQGVWLADEYVESANCTG